MNFSFMMLKAYVSYDFSEHLKTSYSKCPLTAVNENLMGRYLTVLESKKPGILFYASNRGGYGNYQNFQLPTTNIVDLFHCDNCPDPNIRKQFCECYFPC